MPCSIQKGEIPNQSCHYSNAPARFHQSAEPVGLRVRPAVLHKECGTGSRGGTRRAKHLSTRTEARQQQQRKKKKKRGSEGGREGGRGQQGVTERKWCALLNTGALPGSVWALCSSYSTLAQPEEVRQHHLAFFHISTSLSNRVFRLKKNYMNVFSFFSPFRYFM